MDRVIVFGTIDEGSIPPGRTRVLSSAVEQSRFIGIGRDYLNIAVFNNLGP